MGIFLSTFLGESDIRQLAVDVLLPKILLHRGSKTSLNELDNTATNSDPDPVNTTPEKKTSLNDLQKQSSVSTNPRPSTTPILCQKQLPPQIIKDSNNNPRPSSPTGKGFPQPSGTGLELFRPNSKSKSRKYLGLSSRDTLKAILSADGIEYKDNLHPVEIVAALKFRPEYTATFNYSFNPVTKTEVFRSNCGKDKLIKMEIPLDKNGNADAAQFIKSLIKLSSKYEGTIVINGYTITMEREPTQRLKIISIDIKTSPVVIQLSPKGVRGVTAIRSQTRLEVCATTEFGGVADKRIKIEGPNAPNIKLYSPEGKGKLYVCIPTLDRNGNVVLPKTIENASPAPTATTMARARGKK